MKYYYCYDYRENDYAPVYTSFFFSNNLHQATKYVADVAENDHDDAVYMNVRKASIYDAIINHDFEVIDYLIKIENVNLNNKIEGYSPLEHLLKIPHHPIAWVNGLSAVELMLQHGADMPGEKFIFSYYMYIYPRKYKKEIRAIFELFIRYGWKPSKGVLFNFCNVLPIYWTRYYVKKFGGNPWTPKYPDKIWLKNYYCKGNRKKKILDVSSFYDSSGNSSICDTYYLNNKKVCRELRIFARTHKDFFFTERGIKWNSDVMFRCAKKNKNPLAYKNTEGRNCLLSDPSGINYLEKI